MREPTSSQKMKCLQPSQVWGGGKSRRKTKGKESGTSRAYDSTPIAGRTFWEGRKISLNPGRKGEPNQSRNKRRERALTPKNKYPGKESREAKAKYLRGRGCRGENSISRQGGGSGTSGSPP